MRKEVLFFIWLLWSFVSILTITIPFHYAVQYPHITLCTVHQLEHLHSLMRKTSHILSDNNISHTCSHGTAFSLLYYGKLLPNFNNVSFCISYKDEKLVKSLFEQHSIVETESGFKIKHFVKFYILYPFRNKLYVKGSKRGKYILQQEWDSRQYDAKAGVYLMKDVSQYFKRIYGKNWADKGIKLHANESSLWYWRSYWFDYVS